MSRPVILSGLYLAPPGLALVAGAAGNLAISACLFAVAAVAQACVFARGLILEERIDELESRAPTPLPHRGPLPPLSAPPSRIEPSQAAAGPSEGRLAGLPLPSGPWMPADNRTTSLRRDPSPQGTPAAASGGSRELSRTRLKPISRLKWPEGGREAVPHVEAGPYTQEVTETETRTG